VAPVAKRAISRGTVARNTVAVATARVVDIACGLVTVRLLAPYLGPAGYGDYAFVWAYVLAIQPLVNFETDRILIREAARNRDRARELFGAALLIKAVLVAPFLILVGAAYPFLSRPVALALVFAGLSELAYHLHMLNSAFFQARERMDVDLTLILLYRFAFLGGVFLGVSRGGALPFFFAAALAGSLLRTVAGTVLVAKRMGFPTFHKETARGLVAIAWPLTISALLTGFTLKVHIFLLRGLSAPEEVGYFQMAHAIILQVQILPGALMVALFPGLSRLFSKDRGRLSGIVDGAFRLFLLASGLAALAFFAAASLLVAILGAGKFESAALPLEILSLALPAIFAVTLFSFTLVSADGQHLLVFGSSLGLAANLLLGFLLVPPLGAVGASVAALTSYYIIALAFGGLLKWRLPGCLTGRLVFRAVLLWLSAACLLLLLCKVLPLPLAAAIAGILFAAATLPIAKPELKRLLRR